MKNMFDEVAKNKMKSWFLVIFFFILIGILGAFLGLSFGNMYSGLIIASIVSIGYFLFAYFSGDKMIMGMSGAKEVTKKEYPHLFHAVEGLSIAAGIPTPKAYVINDTALNAFATGRDPKHGSVCVTTGLMEKLNRQELEGVLAHEISHIKNFDIRMMMLTALLIGIITLLSDFILRSFLFGGKSRDNNNGGGIQIALIVLGLVLAILAPLIGQMIKLAISRKREYAADAQGAILTRYPEGLASALNKIKGDPDPLVDKANKATAHLFISMPFRKKGKGSLSRLFATHPPIDDRIKRLKAM